MDDPRLYTLLSLLPAGAEHAATSADLASDLGMRGQDVRSLITLARSRNWPVHCVEKYEGFVAWVDPHYAAGVQRIVKKHLAEGK